MKYERMLCWVRPHEKKELKKAVNGQFSLVFARNYDDFKAQIREGDYLVFSLSKARFSIKKIRQLVQDFSKHQFRLYCLKEQEEQTFLQTTIMDESNVVTGQYTEDELVNNFLEIIPDLWEYRLSKNPTIVKC